MKKSKVLQFGTYNLSEPIFQELLKSSPLEESTTEKINQLLSQDEIDTFLTSKLKAADIQTVDLICYLIEKSNHLPENINIENLINNQAVDFYVRNRIYLLSQNFNTPDIKEPEKKQVYVAGEEIKRTSLIEMLDIAEQSDFHAANLINQLLDSPIEQIIEMIKYVGNFDDQRILLLLKFFALSGEEVIQEEALYYIGMVKTKQAMNFLSMYINNFSNEKDSKLLEVAIKSLQKVAYSSVPELE